MNIYEKLQGARVKLQGTNLKKSGNNKFAGYDYFELGDFLPAINQIMNEMKLSSFIGFNSEIAMLTIVNCEKPEEQIQFTSPMATAQLKGCHDVQNLGAVQTYLRRYLYVNAFEIVEHDALEPLTGSDASKSDLKGDTATKGQGDINSQVISESQAKRLYALSKGNTKAAKEIMMKYGYTESKQIKKSDYEAICNEIEQAVK